MDREKKQQERKEYIKRASFIIEYSNKPATKEEFEKIKQFEEYLTKEYSKENFFALSELFNENIEAVYDLMNTIKNFAINNIIPFNVVLQNLMIMSEVKILSMKKVFTKKDFDEIETVLSNPNSNAKKHLLIMINIFSTRTGREDFIEYLNKRLSEMVKHYTNLPINETDAIVSQAILYDSYEEAKKQVLSNINNANLPLSKYKLNSMGIINELSEESKIFDDIFMYKNTLHQMNNNNHFLKHLLNDEMEATLNGNVIFKGHTEALIMGYTQKAISLSLNKNKTLTELQKGLEILNKYSNRTEAKELIRTTEALIKIIEQKKYSTMIPFKAMAKVMGITKNQAKQYAKRLSSFYSIHNKTFEQHFDNLKVYNPKDYIN